MPINSDRVEIIRRLNERADENARKWGQEHDDQKPAEHFEEIVKNMIHAAVRNEQDRARLLVHAGATIINWLEKEHRAFRKKNNVKTPANTAE